MMNSLLGRTHAHRWPLLAAALVACLGIASARLGAQSPLLSVSIDSGIVSGVPESDSPVIGFKGIPFAAPPVGELRWKPPVPAHKWQGVLKADHFGPSCMQPDPSYVHPPSISEDCLTLNVWTPAKMADAKLPVMVWIYGGGFKEGATDYPMYYGQNLAAKGVVVVSMNYRLGIFGYLTHPDLDKESPRNLSGNYGTLDQIAALQWVQNNIAAFGGDPARVTIFGQSAGGGSVHFLSVSPLAKGLFLRGISENGLLYHDDPFLLERSPSAYKSLAEAEADDLDYLKRVGADSLAKLRAMSADQLNTLPAPPFPPAFYSPTIDGWVLPESFEKAYARGHQNDVALMAGWTTAYYPGLKITVDQYNSWARKRFGPMADEFLKLYPVADGQDPQIPLEQAARDSYRSSVYLWAQSRQFKASKHKFFIYSFNHAIPVAGKDKDGSRAGAEIPYAMRTLKLLTFPGLHLTPTDFDLEDLTSAYWVNFAATGDPNGKGLPVWPVNSAAKKLMMQIGDDTKVIPPATSARFDFFRRYFASKPPRCGFATGCSIDMQ